MEETPKPKPTFEMWSDEDMGDDVSSRIFQNREEISRYVGYPVLSTCEDLYDKNIRTVDSLWKRREVVEFYGFVSIVIQYDTLSKENKEIANQLAREQGTEITEARYRGEKMTVCEVRLPVDTHTQPEEVERGLREIASRFESQEKTWG
jgi:hypothetical protein